MLSNLITRDRIANATAIVLTFGLFLVAVAKVAPC